MREGINVIGYFQGQSGLAEAGRLIVAALKEQGIPYSLISADSFVEGSNKIPYEETFDNVPKYDINLFCIDIFNIESFLQKHSYAFFKGRYNIFRFFWETTSVPKDILRLLRKFDEIWAPTSYIKNILGPLISLPVTLIPQPMRLQYSPQAPQKGNFGLPDKFMFLFCFDFHGHLARKNPMAIVKAFTTAFPQRNDVQLVIKSHNGHLHKSVLDACLEAVNKDSRIRWIDELMERHRVYDLMNACDCYVSLHRSEGLGLTMAEAMLMGKPVIATGYSGNMDFTTHSNSYLCSYKLVRVGPDHFPYPPEGSWADVDNTEAASWMTHVADHRAEANNRGAQARTDILCNNSTAAVGSLIAERIALLLHSGGFSETMRSHRKHVRHILSVYKKYWSDLWIHYRGAIQRRIDKIKARGIRD